MPEHDELTIERSADLEIDIDELWDRISTREGWKSWLVDDAHVEVAPGSTGSAVEDGRTRSVRIDAIAHRSGVAFSWWDDDDPLRGSFVDLTIVELPGGRSQLHITERFVGATESMAMRSATSMSAGVAWDVRLVSLWLMALHCTVMA
ncbi:MAG TPA: hypothetical protein VGC84_19670 [Ilumatobacteraceae bacterium]